MSINCTKWYHKGYFKHENYVSSMVYHNTEVFRLENDIVTLRNDGFKTKTTLKRINEAFSQDFLKYIPRFLNNWKIYQKKSNWFVKTGTGKIIPFTDGMKIFVLTETLV